MWVFGYGSLMWKVDFPFERKVIGYVKGFERKFYQHSVDHRGTPEKPGRVVTLIPGDKEARVYGISYKISKDQVDDVVSHLDYREKGGYERKAVLFYPKNENEEPFEIVIYLANNENPQYAGPAELTEIARQVVTSVGPSGPNIDYVCNLAKIMRDILPEIDDAHLFSLEKHVLNLLDRKHCDI
ncbi:unnamed protein product [Brassicogethes aeneus]|uniref:glutathione-specific gamma-glutamylcyclotransferase n=1 Tax=Brassicogethes aeneus TaxID=1431903 RepID=A0A9P0BH00_BRAAE|nr:unnamed protein product [Brassicogethes aeneus]